MMYVQLVHTHKVVNYSKKRHEGETELRRGSYETQPDILLADGVTRKTVVILGL